MCKVLYILVSLCLALAMCHLQLRQWWVGKELSSVMQALGLLSPTLSPCVQRENITLSHLCRSSQYSMVAGASRENGMETPMHENPEWEKARQALASISKAGAASSSKASTSGSVASAQVRMACSTWELLYWGGEVAGFQRMDTLGGL